MEKKRFSEGMREKLLLTEIFPERTGIELVHYMHLSSSATFSTLNTSWPIGCIFLGYFESATVMPNRGNKHFGYLGTHKALIDTVPARYRSQVIFPTV